MKLEQTTKVFVLGEAAKAITLRVDLDEKSIPLSAQVLKLGPGAKGTISDAEVWERVGTFLYELRRDAELEAKGFRPESVSFLCVEHGLTDTNPFGRCAVCDPPPPPEPTAPPPRVKPDGECAEYSCTKPALAGSNYCSKACEDNLPF